MNAFAGAILWILAIAAYFIPSITASWRHVPNSGSVFVVNLLLGWSGIGWVVALAMACRSHPAVLTLPQVQQPAPLQQPEPGEIGPARG